MWRSAKVPVRTAHAVMPPPNVRGYGEERSRQALPQVPDALCAVRNVPRQPSRGGVVRREALGRQDLLPALRPPGCAYGLGAQDGAMTQPLERLPQAVQRCYRHGARSVEHRLPAVGHRHLFRTHLPEGHLSETWSADGFATTTSSQHDTNPRQPLAHIAPRAAVFSSGTVRVWASRLERTQRAPLRRLHSAHSIWQLSSIVLPPADHGVM